MADFESLIASYKEEIDSLTKAKEDLEQKYNFIVNNTKKLNKYLNVWRKQVHIPTSADRTGFKGYRLSTHSSSKNQDKSKHNASFGKIYSNGYIPTYILAIYPHVNSMRCPLDYGRGTVRMMKKITSEDYHYPHDQPWNIDSYLANDRDCHPLFFSSSFLKDLLPKRKMLRLLDNVINYEVRVFDKKTNEYVRYIVEDKSSDDEDGNKEEESESESSDSSEE